MIEYLLYTNTVLGMLACGGVKCTQNASLKKFHLSRDLAAVMVSHEDTRQDSVRSRGSSEYKGPEASCVQGPARGWVARVEYLAIRSEME